MGCLAHGSVADDEPVNPYQPAILMLESVAILLPEIKSCVEGCNTLMQSGGQKDEILSCIRGCKDKVQKLKEQASA